MVDNKNALTPLGVCSWLKVHEVFPTADAAFDAYEVWQNHLCQICGSDEGVTAIVTGE
jgi:hypothetical protein